MLIIICESPSTTSGVFPNCKAHEIPFIKPSSSAILLVLLPIDPQSMLRIIPSKFLNAPLNPTGLGFPLVASSNLNLKEPSGGHVQVFTLFTEFGAILVHVLLTGNSTIPNSYKIILSFASSMKYSRVH